MDRNTCLGIPIDHRLRRKIKPVPDDVATQNLGAHVVTFLRHALSRGVSWEERKFGENLARPFSKGGLLVVLAQPSASQKYNSNFEETTQKCLTLQATDELLKATSNNSKNIFNTSTFDILPLVKKQWKWHGDRTGGECTEAQETFLSMVNEKDPRVILCLSGNLPGLLPQASTFASLGGVGSKFGPQNEGYFLGATRINVFHLSYAVNYHPVHSVFRDLLILESAHAFGVLRGDWVEESWMDELRNEAGQEAKLLRRGKSPYKKLT